jgi:hypothetical protein
MLLVTCAEARLHGVYVLLLRSGAQPQFSSWGTTLTYSGFTEKFWGTNIEMVPWIENLGGLSPRSPWWLRLCLRCHFKWSGRRRKSMQKHGRRAWFTAVSQSYFKKLMFVDLQKEFYKNSSLIFYQYCTCLKIKVVENQLSCEQVNFQWHQTPSVPRTN